DARGYGFAVEQHARLGRVDAGGAAAVDIGGFEVQLAVGALAHRLEVEPRQVAILDFDNRVLDAGDVLGVRRRVVEIPMLHAAAGADELVGVAAGREREGHAPVPAAVVAHGRHGRREVVPFAAHSDGAGARGGELEGGGTAARARRAAVADDGKA